MSIVLVERLKCQLVPTLKPSVLSLSIYWQQNVEEKTEQEESHRFAVVRSHHLPPSPDHL